MVSKPLGDEELGGAVAVPPPPHRSGFRLRHTVGVPPPPHRSAFAL
jgi:hypothetical protein